MKPLRFGRGKFLRLNRGGRNPGSRLAQDSGPFTHGVDVDLRLPPRIESPEYESPDEVRAALGLPRDTRRPGSE